MQQAVIPGYRLAKSRPSTKVLTSLGLLGLFLGLLAASLLTIAKTGLYPSTVEEYYLGIAQTGTAQVTTELDTMMAISTARPVAELAEVTHLHLLGGSMLLFMLCHLLSVCEVSESFRTRLYSLSFISFLLTFLSPWLIIYASAKWSYLYGPSIIVFLLSLVILTAIPLWEMWWRAKNDS